MSQATLQRTLLWGAIGTFILSPVLYSAVKYLYLQQIPFIIEAPCKPDVDLCFVRDCSDPDSCPPNGLSEYSQYYVSAKDFYLCNDNSCAEECASGTILCEKILCDPGSGDQCTTRNF